VFCDDLTVQLIKLYEVRPTQDERAEKLETFTAIIFYLVYANRSALKALTVILT
jgi:hypothetical protein